MGKMALLLTGLGALGAAFGVVLTANDSVPLGTVIVAAGVLLFSFQYPIMAVGNHQG